MNVHHIFSMTSELITRERSDRERSNLVHNLSIVNIICQTDSTGHLRDRNVTCNKFMVKRSKVSKPLNLRM